jgi:hypothetical protein
MVVAAATAVPRTGQDAIVNRGIAALRQLLPPGWKVDLGAAAPGAEADTGADVLIGLQDPQGVWTQLIVEAKPNFAPRDVETLLGGQLRLLRRLDPTARVVVFAPWLSPRTRALLEEQKVGYLDLTGNVRLQLARPAIVIRTTGAEQNPAPASRGGVSVRGVVAGRVVRLLVDVHPPYTASAIARVAGVSVPYVSRLLMTLDREALVQRGRRGLVVDVDWANLLRRRAETYQLYATNAAQGYLSATGAREAAQRLRQDPSLSYRAVTGSFAAAQRAPIAAPSQLNVYVDDPEATAEAMGLLPADQAADVVLLKPYDFVVLDRSEFVDGLYVVAPSQLALDCLTGNGRMPAEGEALLDWMAQHEAQWRRTSIDAMEPRAATFP